MFSRFFVRRPVFAWVIAILIMLAGILAIRTLPVAQYPDVAPAERSSAVRRDGGEIAEQLPADPRGV